MRRCWIMLLIVATATMMALPAIAKKPPTPEPTTYMATIETLSGDGVESTCVGAVAMTRTDERRGAVTHFESGGAQLRINVDGLAFEGDAIGGCAGDEVWPEYFRITFDGDQVAMLWIFDVVSEETIVGVNEKNGKTRTEETRTDFRMGGPYVEEEFAAWGPLSPDEADGVITTGGVGTFVFVQYDSSGTPISTPIFADLEDGSRTFEQTFKLRITLTPTP